MKINCGRKRVVVAMSGGADSSVAAGLLKKQGYDVVGIFIRFWKSALYREAERNAKKAAEILNIPLHIIDAKEEFKKEIVDYFLRGCEKGYMFNPCVKCNPEIKFKFILDKVKELKCDLAATGHYAKIISNFQFPISNEFSILKSKKEEKKYHLFQAKDKNKDQSYFLYGLKQGQLAKIIFPLGNYRKSEVLEMAEEFNLPKFEKKDESQGACFIAEKYPSKFLKKNLKMKEGKIVDARGKVLGEHQGLPLYIIGQRRMINIGGTGPYYVIGRDFSKNILIVTDNKKDPRLYESSMEVKNVSWVVGKPKLPCEANIRIRYQHPAICAIINKKVSGKGEGEIYKVAFNEKQRAVVTGQSAVFYSNRGEVLGGGIIK